MKILFIRLEGEANHIRDILVRDRQALITEIPTDDENFLKVFIELEPQVVFIRFLGAHSHSILMHMRHTSMPVKVITYTFDYGPSRVDEKHFYKFDGYFH